MLETLGMCDDYHPVGDFMLTVPTVRHFFAASPTRTCLSKR